MADSPANQLLGLDLAELSALVEDLKEPAYRAQQLFESLYRQRVQSVDQVSTLPSRMRHELNTRGISIGLTHIENKFESTDGTIRYLVACPDGQTVEAVWMPEGDGGETGDGSEAGDETTSAARSRSRATICVSSQVGCAVECQFCLTALLGVKRNLTAGEIVGQVCSILQDQQVTPPNQQKVELGTARECSALLSVESAGTADLRIRSAGPGE
jgi:23S rRNA (adenine2503-C2)-methyltransferase